MKPVLPQNVRSLLEKQQYRIIGKHSAVKICFWTRRRLTRGMACYKELWYGNVQSHRCMQMTPFLGCNYRCTYCWRIHSGDRPGYSWQEYPVEVEADEPSYIIDEAIRLRRSLLTGYKSNPLVDGRVFEESLNPTMVTFSLTGEPTLYPRLSELIEEARKRGMVTYLVTNGSMPEVLENLSPLPDQLYVSIQAANEDAFKRIARPLMKNAWSRLFKTLETLPSLNGTRRILRITVVKGFNDFNPEEYSRLIEISKPDYVEVKAYEWVGESQSRLPKEAMPWMSDIVSFSERVSKASGYVKRGEFEPSGVVLLSRI
ncbi:MAG: 4-demethylwyosine synthase TYW1 [Thermoproteota archaeon]|nr:4-demethylwyosine synthase TYW1 [Candidatus Brockarchaeota archaeon]